MQVKPHLGHLLIFLDSSYDNIFVQYFMKVIGLRGIYVIYFIVWSLLRFKLVNDSEIL